MSQNTKQQTATEQSTPLTERELIESAAAAVPVGDTTTTQKAMNIMEASVIQRKAVAEAFEAQKKAITGAVEEQRALAMQQMAATQKKYAVTEAHEKQLVAQEATKNLGVLTREALGEKPAQSKPADTPSPEQVIAGAANVGEAEPADVSAEAPAPSTDSQQAQAATPSASRPTTPQPEPASVQPPPTPAPAPHPTAQQSAPQQGMAGQYEQIPDTSVTNELALTIRSIITEEVDKQLKTLLAVVTASEDAETPTT